MTTFGLLALIGIYLIIGTFVLDIGINFALKHMGSPGHAHLTAVANNRTNAMQVAMLAIIMTWPVVIAVAVMAAHRRQRAFHRLQ